MYQNYSGAFQKYDAGVKTQKLERRFKTSREKGQDIANPKGEHSRRLLLANIPVK